jgi:hypothetical protein
MSEYAVHPFACPNCERLCHFEVRVCPDCHATLGYDPQLDELRFLADDATAWRARDGGDAPVVACANNNDYQICNWLVPSADATPMCVACRHNHIIPDLTVPGVPERWAKVEAAKRRLFHTLIGLGLPLDGEHLKQRLVFDFLYDPAAESARPAEVLTGHDDGLITLNLIEADDAERERARMNMGEPYRTLLGHFRHEVGHHFWSVLVETDETELAAYREIFGDERQDYDAALQAHYARSDLGDWNANYVSFYATSHPWEDFAETFAHYLHIVDLLATVRGFGLSLAAFPADHSTQEIGVDFDPYTASAQTLAAQMQPLSFALNSLGRSLGQHDLYPFALEQGVVAKLDHVADLVARARASTSLETAR